MADKIAEKKDWTVMVYLAGDNNLTDESVYALTEMKKVGTSERVNIIAQFDPKDDYLPTRRYVITKNIEPGKLEKNIIEKPPFTESAAAVQLETARRQIAIAYATKRGTVTTIDEGDGSITDLEGETDTGDPLTLFKFISFGIEKFPANHYMVVLAGHGAGTESDYLLKDDSPAGYLTIPELKWVFEQVKGAYKDEAGNGLVIDILGMDICCMSMAEVCFEFKDLVQIIVGSESYSPASGWPYRPILERLERDFAGASPQSEPVAEGHDLQSEFARAIVTEYANFYSDYWLGGLSVDQSALDIRKAQGLEGVVRDLAAAFIKELSGEDTADETKRMFKDAIVLAHWEAQSFNGELFVDLFDFCDCLRQRYGAGEIFEACTRTMDFISSSFVLRSCYSGPVYQYSYGISIYFPWSRVAPDYKNLTFAESSRWREFLDVYTEATRRPMRSVDQAIRFAAASPLPQREFRQVGGKGPENPVRSMRNPPIMALPNDCIRDRQSLIDAMETIFLK
jgi:Clostripain family